MQENKQENQQENKHTLFDRIAFLNLKDEDKSNIAQEIIQENTTSRLYRLELVLSCAIATLWLLTNSIPVIIGAMLIAPFFNPLKRSLLRLQQETEICM